MEELTDSVIIAIILMAFAVGILLGIKIGKGVKR